MLGIVYMAINKINGKIYIGQTVKKLSSRKHEHINHAMIGRYTMPFHKAIRKYGGEEFDWFVLECCDSKDEMDEMEFHYIMQYRTYTDGYNATLGGDGTHGVAYTDERREKAKERIYNSPIYGKCGNDHPMFGRKHSDETRFKISIKVKGKNHPNYGKKLKHSTEDIVAR